MSVHTFPKPRGNNDPKRDSNKKNFQDDSYMKQSDILGKVDLKEGVVPITKAATSLAALLKRAVTNHEHIVLTQKGRTAGVLLDIDEYTKILELAKQQLEVQILQNQEQDEPTSSLYSGRKKAASDN